MIDLCLHYPCFQLLSLPLMNVHLILTPLCHLHLLLLIVLTVSSNQMSNSGIFIFTTQPRLLPANLLPCQVHVTLWLGIFPMHNSHQNIRIFFVPSPFMWNLQLMNMQYWIKNGRKLWLQNSMFLKKITLGHSQLFLPVIVQLGENGCIRSNINLMAQLSDTKLGWWRKALLNGKGLTIRRPFLLWLS